MSHEELKKAIDEDIATARLSAKQFFDLFSLTIGAAVVFLIFYVLPDIAAKKLPAEQITLSADIQKYEEKVGLWENKFKAKFSKLDTDQYKKKSEAKELSESEFEANKINYPQYQNSIVSAIKFLALFQVDGSKLESLMKAVPIFLATLCAGFLLTYRFHASAANELVKEKYKILAKGAGIETKSGST